MTLEEIHAKMADAERKLKQASDSLEQLNERWRQRERLLQQLPLPSTPRPPQ